MCRESHQPSVVLYILDSDGHGIGTKITLVALCNITFEPAMIKILPVVPCRLCRPTHSNLIRKVQFIRSTLLGMEFLSTIVAYLIR